MAVNRSSVNVGYGLSNALQALAPQPIVAQRAPSATDYAEIGTIWVDQAINTYYVLTSAGNWIESGNGGPGSFTTLTSTGATTLATTGASTNSFGNQTGATAVNILAGTGGIEVEAANGAVTISSGTSAMNISADALATAINIGTGAAVVKTIAIGGTGANVITIGNTQTAGSVSVGAAMTTGTVSIGGTGLQTGTVSIAPGTGAQTVNIATGGTGIKTVNIATGAIDNVVTIGTATGAASLSLLAGTGGMSLAAGGKISMVPVTASGSSTTVTLNSRVSEFTITGLTTASGATQSITFNNSNITTSSAILAFCYNLNASTNGAAMAVFGTSVAAGVATIILKNNGGGNLGTGDNVSVTVWVLS